jgi:hypothetical protein
MVLLAEPSGSIRHRVERIDDKGEIVICRMIPEIGTDDMAEWTIIIELSNTNKPDHFEVKFIEERV